MSPFFLTILITNSVNGRNGSVITHLAQVVGKVSDKDHPVVLLCNRGKGQSQGYKNKRTFLLHLHIRLAAEVAEHWKLNAYIKIH